MRIAVFNIDSLASNAALRLLVDRLGSDLVYVGLSPPFKRKHGSALAQRQRHLKRSGLDFSVFMACNFMIPRHAARVYPNSATLPGLCQSRGVQVEHVEDVNADSVRQRLAELKVDLIVSCYFDQVFQSKMIELPEHGILNVHSSLLPENRGPMPVIDACLSVPPQLGVSVHQIDEGIDTGPIFAQEHYEPGSNQSVLAMMTDLHVLGVRLLDEVLGSISSGNRPASIKSQEGGSYAGFPDRETMLRFRKTGKKLVNRHDLARAFTTPIGF